MALGKPGWAKPKLKVFPIQGKIIHFQNYLCLWRYFTGDMFVIKTQNDKAKD